MDYKEKKKKNILEKKKEYTDTTGVAKISLTIMPESKTRGKEVWMTFSNSGVSKVPQMKLKHKLPLNPKSCAWRTVRPNKLKGQSLQQRKGGCKDQTRSMGGLCSKDPNFLMVFREECLKAKFGVRAAGCRTFFWLVGGEVTGWCSRSNVFSLRLASPA